ncbi:MAG: fatty acid desaturase [Deltaproteobacteria bacterium]|nr:MAG: fatty acid desaturase [Deltaproteobacteria bacterium]
MFNDLNKGPRFSIPRLGVDLILWLTIALVAEAIGHPVAAVLAAIAIGFGPLHDVLVHGHEATHGNASRSRRLNAAVLWLCHALVGLSGRAYRSFHLDHHRAGHGPDDSELVLYGPKPRGVDYLRIAWASHWVINTYRGRTPVCPAHVWADLAGATLLHAAIVAVVGPRGWVFYLIVPALTALPVAVILRAITEHHGAPLGGTRATAAHPLLRLLWSNVDHHLEHHLAPSVPWHRLPQVRRRLEGITYDRGLIPTALRLLAEPQHIAADAFVRRDLAHRIKTRWFRDILRSAPARRHLWSLYFHGEAYEQLHPLGVWIDKLEPRLGRNLRLQLDEENHHATLFAGLLDAMGGYTPRPLDGEEDVGWFLLHHVIPDVCEAAGRPGRFDRMETMRYLGFLHALESRSVSDLCALRDAAEAEGLDEIACIVTRILEDERWHASWTWVALCRTAHDPDEALAVFEPIRRAERRASLRVVKRLLVVFTELGAAPRGLDRLRWSIMAVAARLGLAVPLLPLHDPRGRVPRHLEIRDVA